MSFDSRSNLMMYFRIRNRYLVITAFLLVIWLNYSGIFLRQALARPSLFSNVSLTLVKGLWKSSQNTITYQDITLDLVCTQSDCEQEVWGFAPEFNTADHQGKVTVIDHKKSWHLQVDLVISRDPWSSVSGKATYTLELKKQGNQITGTYSGRFQDKSFNGQVKGIITPHYPTIIPNHRPIEPQEHPRLIFRREQIPHLQGFSRTKYGQAILTQLNNTLAQPVSYQGYVPNGGYHAAGYCLLYILNQDRQAATRAWQLVENSINQPGARLFEQSPIVAGVALAYDLCYEGWTQQQIDTVTRWLAQQAAILVEGEAGRGWNATSWSNWSARARGAAGLAALAILEPDDTLKDATTRTKITDTLKGAATRTKPCERKRGNHAGSFVNYNTVKGAAIRTNSAYLVSSSSVLAREGGLSWYSPTLQGVGVGVGIKNESDPPQPPLIRGAKEMKTLLKIAERNIIRFLTIGIGDHGFGSEGDHYTTEPLILTVIPFLLAYQNVMGEDLVKGSSAEWFLPHYLSRAVEREGTLFVPTYGRHRSYAGGSLFAMGLRLVPAKFLPGVMWGFKRYWGMDGDKTFGITSPYQAAYVLVGYQDYISSKNPALVLNRVLVDEQKGFYVFRNKWRNKDDFVASIYLKREELPSSWSFPDAGSFRIVGLGENWGVAGPSNKRRDSENVVIKNEPENPTSQPIFFQSFKNGSGVVSLKGDNWIRSFAVDYSQKSGVLGLFVIVDKFSYSGEQKTWVMHTKGKVSLFEHEQKCLIEGTSGATMQLRFITPEKVKLSFESTEMGGKILAKGSDQFFVVMTVQGNKAPKIEVLGNGLDAMVKVGNQRITFKNNKIILK